MTRNCFRSCNAVEQSGNTIINAQQWPRRLGSDTVSLCACLSSRLLAPERQSSFFKCLDPNMGNAGCTSCCWWRGSPAASSSNNLASSKKPDGEWFDGSSVPLVTARFDDEINTESVVKKTVVLRAARPASPPGAAPELTAGSNSPRSTRTSSKADEEYRGHRHRSSSPRKATSPMASSSPLAHSSSPLRRHQRTGSLSEEDASLSAIGFDSETSNRVLTNDDEEMDHSSCHREFSPGERKESSDDVATAHHRSHKQKEESRRKSLEEDEQEEMKEEAPPSAQSPRSSRSASRDSSSTTSSTETTKRKVRYGRKNYRANSNRKKTR